MQTFKIIYYCRSENDHILRFTREAKFQSTPFIGSHLSLENDNLKVDDITFVENGMIEISVEKDSFKDADAARFIDEMKSMGWSLSSDSKS